MLEDDVRKGIRQHNRETAQYLKREMNDIEQKLSGTVSNLGKAMEAREAKLDTRTTELEAKLDRLLKLMQPSTRNIDQLISDEN